MAQLETKEKPVEPTYLATCRLGNPGGLPLVLLHGFPVDGHMWDLLLPELAARGVDDVLVVDGPGWGGSAHLVGPGGHGPVEGLEGYADAVAATLRALGIERAAVAGLSMGGYVAMALAERHPELVAALALLDTKSTLDAPQVRAGRLDMAERALTEGAGVVAPMAGAVLAPATLAGGDVLDAYRAMAGASSGQAIAWAQRAMAARPDRTDALRALARAATPGLVLRGEHDVPCSPADAEHMAAAMGCRVVTVAGAGHFPPMENPAATAQALAELVRQAAR